MVHVCLPLAPRHPPPDPHARVGAACDGLPRRTGGWADGPRRLSLQRCLGSPHRDGVSFFTLQGVAGDAKTLPSQGHARGLLPGISVRNPPAGQWLTLLGEMITLSFLGGWVFKGDPVGSGCQNVFFRPEEARRCDALWVVADLLLRSHSARSLRAHAWCRQSALSDCISRLYLGC